MSATGVRDAAESEQTEASRLWPRHPAAALILARDVLQRGRCNILLFSCAQEHRVQDRCGFGFEFGGGNEFHGVSPCIWPRPSRPSCPVNSSAFVWQNPTGPNAVPELHACRLKTNRCEGQGSKDVWMCAWMERTSDTQTSPRAENTPTQYEHLFS